MSIQTSVAQKVEVSNNFFQLDNNPYISQADKVLLSKVVNVNSRFSSVTRWDDVIIANRAQIENQTTPIVQRGQYITFNTDLLSTNSDQLQASDAWTKIATDLVKNFKDSPITGLQDPSMNKLFDPTITSGYLDVLKRLFADICNVKYRSTTFNSTYFDTLINRAVKNVSIITRYNGEPGVIDHETYIQFCQQNIVTLFALPGTYTASQIQLFLIVFRPWLIANYLVLLIRNTSDSVTSTKPRTLYMQSVVTIVFRLYMIQTYMVLKQLILSNVGIDDLIKFEVERMLQDIGGASGTTPTVFSELGNILSEAKSTNSEIMAVGSVLEQQKINLEKALANDVAANSRLKNWTIVFWVVFVLFVLLLALGITAVYLPENQVISAVSIYVSGIAILAVVVYWLVIAIKK
jgi:hypothetical protein